MKEWKLEVLTNDQVKACGADLSKDNECITETAGFIPLEVKMKQFEQNGIIAQFKVDDFTSSDYRDMYLTPDFDISPEDDLEDIQEKLDARNQFIEKIKAAKSIGQNEKAGTEEAEKKAAKADKSSAAEEQRDGAESDV